MNAAVVRRGAGKLRHDVSIGRHTLAADEPVEKGGDGTAPEPMELLAAALGACTAITLRMYAAHKGWPLEDASVAVSVEKTQEGAAFDRVVTLSGPLDEAQRARLLKVAESCPVHKVLTGKNDVRTRLA